MAKDSGIGTIIGLGVAGVGVYWVGGLFGWWPSIFGTVAAATTTTAATTTAATPTITLSGPVTPTLNNALQANFTINGAQEVIAVIPNGDAYNNSGDDITAQLAAEGVTPAQLYAIMAAAYTPPAATTTPVTTTTPASTTPSTTPTGRAGGSGKVPVVLKRPGINTKTGRGTSGYGMGGPMVYASPRNYVPRGSRFR